MYNNISNLLNGIKKYIHIYYIEHLYKNMEIVFDPSVIMKVILYKILALILM